MFPGVHCCGHSSTLTTMPPRYHRSRGSTSSPQDSVPAESADVPAESPQEAASENSRRAPPAGSDLPRFPAPWQLVPAATRQGAAYPSTKAAGPTKAAEKDVQLLHIPPPRRQAPRRLLKKMYSCCISLHGGGRWHFAPCRLRGGICSSWDEFVRVGDTSRTGCVVDGGQS